MPRRNCVCEPAMFAAVWTALSSTTKRWTVSKYPKALRSAITNSAIPAVVLARRISAADVVEVMSDRGLIVVLRLPETHDAVRPTSREPRFTDPKWREGLTRMPA